MLFNSYSYEILSEQWDIKLLLVTVNNRLKFEIEIVHDLSCHPIYFHLRNTRTNLLTKNIGSTAKIKGIDVYELEVGLGVVLPEIHMFEAIDDQQWQVLDRLANVMKWVWEFEAVRCQSGHQIWSQSTQTI